MGNILRHELRWNYRGTVLWALSLAVLTYLTMYLFPPIARQHAQWDRLVGQLPKAVLAGFGMDQLRLSDIFGYFGTQIYPLLLLFVAIYAVMAFSALISREESEGTIEFLVAKPVSRSAIFLGKAAAGLMLAVVFNGIVFLATWAAFVAFRTAPFSLAVLAWFGSGLLFVTLIFGSLGLLISVYITHPRTLNSVTIGIVVVSYFVGIASAMSHKLYYLRYLSPFQFVDATTIVRHGALPSGDWLGLLTVSLILAALAYGFYRVKDIKP